MSPSTDSVALVLQCRPDADGLAALYALPGLEPDDIVRAARQLRSGQGLPRAFPPHLQSIEGAELAGFSASGALWREQADGELAALEMVARVGATRGLWLADEGALGTLRARSLRHGLSLPALAEDLPLACRLLNLPDAAAVSELATLAGLAADAPAALGLLLVAQQWLHMAGRIDTACCVRRRGQILQAAGAVR